jgi:hypothetical protein
MTSLTQNHKKLLCSQDIALVGYHLAPHFSLYDGWIFQSGADSVWRRMCWLPAFRRNQDKLAYSGQRVCIGSWTGVVTILDFSDVTLPPIASAWRRGAWGRYISHGPMS